MKARVLLMLALAILPGCVQDRPGPRHAGLRSYIYEHTPTDPSTDKNKFQERPPTKTWPRLKATY